MKKLRLNRETLRKLSTDEMKRAQGGRPVDIEPETVNERCIANYTLRTCTMYGSDTNDVGCTDWTC